MTRLANSVASEPISSTDAISLPWKNDRFGRS
jgi:hypothetical protein